MIERVLIVDDEPLAVASLKKKLIQLDMGLDIRTETQPVSAIETIRAWAPHLLFLDISMPEITGFDLLDQLDDAHQNFVLIFCTAHSSHAIDAFEKSALDYLVKPVEPARLAQALEKARKATSGQWIARHRNGASPMQKVSCSDGSKTLWLSVKEIAWFSSEQHETIAHDKEGGEHFCPLSLSHLAKKLDSTLFFRCHRSHIINREYLQLFDSAENQVFLTPYPSMPVPVSRRCKQGFKIFLGV
ncbi:MAG: response regulator transcription factor [Deltaproteobacteria bacterium]|nr:response regulator transcription factor [Deltaproteobacteria bacterium]